MGLDDDAQLLRWQQEDAEARQLLQMTQQDGAAGRGPAPGGVPRAVGGGAALRIPDNERGRHDRGGDNGRAGQFRLPYQQAADPRRLPRETRHRERDGRTDNHGSRREARRRQEWAAHEQAMRLMAREREQMMLMMAREQQQMLMAAHGLQAEGMARMGAPDPGHRGHRAVVGAPGH
jgi:hypothetical protein